MQPLINFLILIFSLILSQSISIFFFIDLIVFFLILISIISIINLLLLPFPNNISPPQYKIRPTNEHEYDKKNQDESADVTFWLIQIRISPMPHNLCFRQISRPFVYSDCD